MEQSLVRNYEDVDYVAEDDLVAGKGVMKGQDVEYQNKHLKDDELAIAVAIEEEEDPTFIPAAIQYDPDAKPPIYKNRRFRFYIIAAVILLMAIGVAAALVAVTAGNNDGDNAATTLAARESKVLASILDETKDSGVNWKAIYLDDRHKDTPYARALNWLINEDEMQVAAGSALLFQRFLCALFYFVTTAQKPWKSCNPPVGDEDSNCTFHILNGTEPLEYEMVEASRWLSSEHECDWGGITCGASKQVIKIELKGQGIRGVLPTEIAQMPYLQQIILVHNEFYGTIPSELGTMKYLIDLQIHSNFFRGQLPAELFQSRTLQRLNVALNYLDGTIPTEIGLATNLKGIHFEQNNMRGTIPTEIGMLRYLTFLLSGRNLFDGPIPSEIGKLGRLKELWLHRNHFTGELPSEMGTMEDIGDIRIQYNDLSGAIPDEIYNLSRLHRFDLQSCNFTSTISPKIENLKYLSTFRLSRNNFYGSIPTEMGNLSALKSVWLGNNNLKGSMPIELCKLRGPTGISILNADCGPYDDVGDPLIDCMYGCCTSCCDPVKAWCLMEEF